MILAAGSAALSFAQDGASEAAIRSRRMPDGKQWTTDNLNVSLASPTVTRYGLELPSIWPFVHVGSGAAGMSITGNWVAIADDSAFLVDPAAAERTSANRLAMG